MCLWNFLLNISRLVNLHLLDLLDVSLSSIMLEITLLYEYRSDKYLFGWTYTPLNESNN